MSFKAPEKLLQVVDKCVKEPYVDPEGRAYELSAEFAPNQVIHSAENVCVLANPFCNTLEADEDFNRFLEELKDKPTKSMVVDSLDQQIERMIAQEKELNPWKYKKKDILVQTPLIEYLMDNMNSSELLTGKSQKEWKKGEADVEKQG